MGKIPVMMDNLLDKKRAEGFAGQLFYRVPQQVVSRIESRPFTRHLIVTCVGYYPETQGHLVERPEGIRESVLIFVERGRGWFSIANKTTQVKAGEAFFLPGSIPHRYGSVDEDPWSLFWLHFYGDIADELLSWTSLPFERGVYICTAWESIRRQFHMLFSALERGYHEHTLLEMSRTLINVLTLLHRNPLGDRPTDAHERIERAMDIMHETLAQPLTLSAYSRHVGYSVPRFSYWFNQITGVSPMTFLNELRIQRACEYLDTTSLSVKEIAEKLGYVDRYYFSRAFKKCTGLAPAHYREKSQST